MKTGVDINRNLTIRKGQTAHLKLFYSRIVLDNVEQNYNAFEQRVG